MIGAMKELRAENLKNWYYYVYAYVIGILELYNDDLKLHISMQFVWKILYFDHVLFAPFANNFLATKESPFFIVCVYSYCIGRVVISMGGRWTAGWLT